ncbi:cytochrome P450 monooxygenase lolP1 [Colletotrichum spaethianum]|uniref:Cytochrome P450 monooxygenase lolP1 n=1 Tax=Colletotrichum spaethianum TaxID=700344 RepID=A0AA37LC81_9PEZI|nr:cytochrome P450 monooxygenase lolP1 [Colletotrichum spaethianum]GKT44664.1 cytochrome P450 monooxygenase lolP1 [Colletotrichum spaethianum]
MFRDADAPVAGLFDSFYRSIPTSGASLLVLLVVVWYLKSWYRLRHFPGPFLNSVSIAPMNFMTLGPLIRVGPNEVLFGDADSYRIIYAVRSDFTKGPWYALSKFVPDQHSLFSLRDDAKRKDLKAKLSPAIRMTMLSLFNTPAALSYLRHEMTTGLAKGLISSPSRDAEARRLPYLQAVIKEGLHMYPPTTGLNYKQVAKRGTELCGKFLPEGTQLGVNIQKLMRSKETFGPDADIFRPERWLEAVKNEERLREMTAVVDLAFGHGRFQCLGKTIANMELNKIFVELLRRFDFAVVTPQKPLVLYDAAFWVTTDFWLRVTERQEQPSGSK